MPRGSGEGSVYRTNDGSGWVARVELPRGANGKRRRVRRRARTKAEAQRILSTLRDEYSASGRVSDGTRTVGETVDSYVQVRRSMGVSESSLSRDERFARYATQYFGSKRTNKITVADLDRFLDDVSQGVTRLGGSPKRQPMGRDHVRRLRSFLQAAFRNDLRRGLVSSNPAELANLPADRGQSQNRRAIQLDELELILNAADGATRALVDLIGRHGLRPAEARAVTWECIDLDRQTVRIKAQLSSVNDICPPKTKRANRVVPLHPEFADWLASERVGRRPRAFVAATDTGSPIDRNNFNRSLRQLCNRLGLEVVGPYELRHTAITHQCRQGYSAWQVADWAGTSERMIYEHYRHLLDDVVDIPPIKWAEGDK